MVLSAPPDETQIKAKPSNLKWVTEATIRERNKWVEQNLGLARQCAHRWHLKCHLPYEELEQVAYIGLIRATERFDKTRGNKFSTFAVPRINGQIINYLRDKGHTIKIPRREYDRVQKSKRTERKLAVVLGRKPLPEEVAREMELPLTELQNCRDAMRNCKNQSPEETLRYHEKDGVKLEAKISILPILENLSQSQIKAIEIYFSGGKSLAEARSQEELIEIVRGAIGLVRLKAVV